MRRRRTPMVLAASPVLWRHPRPRRGPGNRRPEHRPRITRRTTRDATQPPLARRGGSEPHHSPIRRHHRGDPEPRPARRRGHPLRQRVLRVGRVRAEPVHPCNRRLHHAGRCPPHAHAVQPSPSRGGGADAVRGGAAARCPHDERGSARARLLRHEQRQDGPSVRADVRRSRRGTPLGRWRPGVAGRRERRSSPCSTLGHHARGAGLGGAGGVPDRAPSPPLRAGTGRPVRLHRHGRSVPGSRARRILRCRYRPTSPTRRWSGETCGACTPTSSNWTARLASSSMRSSPTASSTKRSSSSTRTTAARCPVRSACCTTPASAYR